MGEGMEGRRECEAAGRTGAGMVRQEDVPNPVSFESCPAKPAWPIQRIRNKEIQKMKYMAVSGTVYFVSSLWLATYHMYPEWELKIRSEMKKRNCNKLVSFWFSELNRNENIINVVVGKINETYNPPIPRRVQFCYL